jgi:hypothetical protein
MDSDRMTGTKETTYLVQYEDYYSIIDHSFRFHRRSLHHQRPSTSTSPYPAQISPLPSPLRVWLLSLDTGRGRTRLRMLPRLLVNGDIRSSVIYIVFDRWPGNDSPEKVCNTNAPESIAFAVWDVGLVWSRGRLGSDGVVIERSWASFAAKNVVCRIE